MLQLPFVFNRLFARCAPLKHAASNGALIPGLVHVMRELQPWRRSVVGSGVDPSKQLTCCFDILFQLEEEPLRDPGSTATAAFWKALIDAGLVSIVIDMLTHGDQPVAIRALQAANGLLVVAPRVRAAGWPKDLLRAVARVMSGSVRDAAGTAAEMLFNLCMLRQDLLAAIARWGFYTGAQQLAKSGDPRARTAAEVLLFLVKLPTDVSSTPTLRMKCSGPLF
jgi:hypothetical protein